MDFNEVIERIKVHQNLSAAKRMKDLGLDYKINYGVSIVTLRQISNQIPCDHDLALSLWKSDVRETKLLAAMIDIPEKVTQEQVLEWSHDFTNSEIVEQTCSNLIWKLDFWSSFVDLWLESENDYLQKAALSIILNFAQKAMMNNEELVYSYISGIAKLAESNSLLVRKAVILTLQSLIDNNAEFKNKICEEINLLQSNTAKLVKSELWWD